MQFNKSNKSNTSYLSYSNSSIRKSQQQPVKRSYPSKSDEQDLEKNDGSNLNSFFQKDVTKSKVQSNYKPVMKTKPKYSPEMKNNLLTSYYASPSSSSKPTVNSKRSNPADFVISSDSEDETKPISKTPENFDSGFKSVSKPKSSLSPETNFSFDSDDEYDIPVRDKKPTRTVFQNKTNSRDTYFEREGTKQLNQLFAGKNAKQPEYGVSKMSSTKFEKEMKHFTIPKIKLTTKKKISTDVAQPTFEDCLEKKKNLEQKKEKDEALEGLQKVLQYTQNLKKEQAKLDEEKKLQELDNEKTDSNVSSSMSENIKRAIKYSNDLKEKELTTKVKCSPEFGSSKEKVYGNQEFGSKVMATKYSEESNDFNNDMSKILKYRFEIKEQQRLEEAKAKSLEIQTAKKVSNSSKESSCKAEVKEREISEDNRIQKKSNDQLTRIDESVRSKKTTSEIKPKVASIFNIKKKSDKSDKSDESDESSDESEEIIERRKTEKKKIRDYDYVAVEPNENFEVEIDGITSLPSLKKEHIKYMILRDINYFLDIFSGNCEHSWRHTEYKKYSKKSGDLLYSHAAGLGSYTQQQILAGVEALQSIFCKSSHKLDEYIVKVVLPEALIKICMRIYQCSKDSAEDYLKENNLKTTSDSLPSDSCLNTFR